MKKITLLAFLGFGLSVFAQNYEVKYYENRTPEDAEKIKTASVSVQESFLQNHNSFTLTYSNGISLYKNDEPQNPLSQEEKEKMTALHKEHLKKKLEKDVLREYGRNTNVTTVSYSDVSDTAGLDQTLYYKQDDMILAQLNQYNIKDNRFDWNWKITDETKEILGYTCKKAISNLMGYNFTAWFTEEIPANAGPDKFDGLNRMILLVEMGNTEIIAYSVKELNEKPKIEKPVFTGKTFSFTEAFSHSQNGGKSSPKKPSELLKKPSELADDPQQKQQVRTYTETY